MKHISYLTYAIIGFVIVLASVTQAQSDEHNLYKVGPNDILHITVMGHGDLSLNATVTTDGTIAYPNLGSVYVKDKTLPEIEKEITDRLSAGYIKFPVGSVSLLQATSKRIFINGEVAKIGAIPYEKDITVIKALSIAGGIRETGLYGKLKVRRLGKDSVGYINLAEEELMNGIMKDKKVEDLPLEPDDILIVERSKTFLIEGEVLKRGRFTLEKNLTVLRALVEAGGVSESGSFGTIRVRRKQEEAQGGYEDFLKSNLNDGSIEKREVEDLLLQPDDILIVEKSRTFLIEGEVARRGKFTLEKNMTVLRALLEAGGVSENGLYGNIKIRRKQEGQGEYKELAESKLEEGVILSREVEDLVLKPDDILIVERNKTYFIYGEANRTGEFILRNDMTVFEAITIAGGFTKWGSPTRVKILRPTSNGESSKTIEVDLSDVLKGNASADVVLQPGDTIVISSGIL